MSLDVSKPEPAQVRVDIGCTGSTATLNMSSTRAGLLHRILSLWISPWHMRRGMAAAVWAARPLPVDAKRARLPEVPAIFIPPAAFLSLPDSLLEEILQFLPTKDRLSHVPLICTHTAAFSRRLSPLWRELVLDAEVVGTCLKLDVLESWLSVRGAAVKILTVQGLRTWSNNSKDGESSISSIGVMPKVFAPCKVSLQSLTITDCGSLFAEADFAAVAELSLLQMLHIHTDAEVRPACINPLTALTQLNSLSLTVSPGDRADLQKYYVMGGFPHAVTSLTALTSLTLSGFYCLGKLPEGMGQLTALKELLFPDCVVLQLPMSLQNLTSLERLDLSSNGLGRPEAPGPPNCLLNAHKLTSIKLSGNYYSALPTYLSSVTALQSLHIAANNIGDGSTACLSHLTALTKLVMQQCNLSAVPESLAALSRLKWLCLSRNRLGSIPEGLPWQQLEVLHLRGNELKCVPCDALYRAVALEMVDCGENQPLQIDQYLLVWGLIKQLPKLQTLYIDKAADGDDALDISSWSAESRSQIAALKKIMKKRKHRVCLK